MLDSRAQADESLHDESGAPEAIGIFAAAAQSECEIHRCEFVPAGQDAHIHGIQETVWHLHSY